MAIGLHTHYPQATLQDVYKTCYQDRFGAEHMAPDSMQAATYLDAELANMTSQSSQSSTPELCGWRHRYERIPLQMVLDGRITKEELLQDFLKTNQTCTTDETSWRHEWRRIERISMRAVPEWRNRGLQIELRKAAKAEATVHHSEAYRKAYQPHYRIVPCTQN